MIALALLSGLSVVGGVWLAWSGLVAKPVAATGAAGPGRRGIEVPSPDRVALVVVAALLALLMTRWPVAAIGAGLAVWVASSAPLRTRSDPAVKAEALTVWAEMLRDATGTPRGIEGVLVATADGAPALIRPHVVRLARRLPYEPLDRALEGLAEDLDHPVGDLVVTALRLSAHAGGRQIRAVLDDLAAMAREEARMHRRIEVARARPRADMKTVLIIMVAFVGLFTLAAHRYLEPYGSPVGQLILCLVASCWGLAVWSMVRLGQSDPVQRFLVPEIEP